VPILEIELVESEATQSLPADLAQSLTDAAAQVLGASKGTVWVKIRVIPSIQYAEDHGKPEGMFPAFVTVLKSRVSEGSELEDEIVRLTHAIASILNRPEANVHIFYQTDGAGRVAFGGKLVR
jgi:phenylpyruvate tautomerase PptA (4-oxalocrotonate tautomerase family)